MQQTRRAQERRRLLTTAVQLYRGPLADNLGDGAHHWLTPARDQTTARIAHLHLTLADLADDNPAALGHLNAATRLATGDPHTTATAINAYRRLGRDDLARTAYRYYEHQMHTLGTHPDPEITQLATATTTPGDKAAQPPPAAARDENPSPPPRPRR